MSYRIRELLKRHEGVKTHAYKDHLGYVTVGVGRCLEEGVGLCRHGFLPLHAA